MERKIKQAKLPLYLTNHHTMKPYGAVEAWLRPFLTSVLHDVNSPCFSRGRGDRAPGPHWVEIECSYSYYYVPVVNEIRRFLPEARVQWQRPLTLVCLLLPAGPHTLPKHSLSLSLSLPVPCGDTGRLSEWPSYGLSIAETCGMYGEEEKFK
jgi:hypothetical protein